MVEPVDNKSTTEKEVSAVSAVPGGAPGPAPQKVVNPAMHSAEHILTASLMKLFGCGRPFTTHIEKKKSKADYRFHRNLDAGELARVEEQVNAVIAANLPVRAEFLTLEEAGESYDLRRLPAETQERIRIIHIGDYDACPCSGPHAPSTGVLGRFRIVSSSFEQEVLRVRFKLDPS
jgi:misacylated tRNA(Ala) deacylase